VEEKDEKFETVLLARGSNEGIHENSWCLDTGASNHMCGKRSMFFELDELVRNVSFVDDSKIPVKGKGNLDSLERWKTSIYFKCLLRS